MKGDSGMSFLPRVRKCNGFRPLEACMRLAIFSIKCIKCSRVNERMFDGTFVTKLHILIVLVPIEGANIENFK